MRRKVSALLGVAVAMLLSVAVAIPANAADSSWWDQYAHKTTNKVQYKYGYDFYKSLPSSPVNGGGVRVVQPVSPVVNPAHSGPASYLNQYRNRVVNPSNVPISGKIIEPGKTLVRAPSTYAPVLKPALSGLGGLTRLLGPGLGVGMGGTSTPPSNWKELSVAQGVPQTCVDDLKTCGKTNMDKVFSITSCGLKGTCNSIGALQQEESDMGKWFKNDVLPILDDLWGNLTGQSEAEDPIPSDTHIEVSPLGCKKDVRFEYIGENNGKLHVSVAVDFGRPASQYISQRASYDVACFGEAATAPNSISPGSWDSLCMEKATGNISSISGSSFGSSGVFTNTYFRVDGSNVNGLCGNNTPATHTLIKMRGWNPNAQTSFSGSGASYDSLNYWEWWNPDPLINTEEAATVTTNWDCQDAAGTTYSYSKSVGKTAALISPDCPVGSDLVKHDVKGPGGRTLDSGAAAPGGLTAYPNCAGGGCAMNVHVDGVVCSVSRPECSTWPAIAASTPSRVKCMWGSYTMPTSDCNALSNGYKTETGVVFDPKSGTWVGIDTYGNPTSANPEPWNPTNPTPTPGVTPGTTPGTTTGTTPGTFPQTGTNPDDGCSSPQWSWNPSEFVKSPVVCALKDTFVPKTDIKARMETIATTAADVAPLSWMSTPIVGPSGGGCPNWTVHVAGLSKNVVCESSFTAAIVGSRGPMFTIVASAMIWPLIRGIWYALIPIVRVSPSGSK